MIRLFWLYSIVHLNLLCKTCDGRVLSGTARTPNIAIRVNNAILPSYPQQDNLLRPSDFSRQTVPYIGTTVQKLNNRYGLRRQEAIPAIESYCLRHAYTCICTSVGRIVSPKSCFGNRGVSVIGDIGYGVSTVHGHTLPTGSKSQINLCPKWNCLLHRRRACVVRCQLHACTCPTDSNGDSLTENLHELFIDMP
jgi:hypothetical protein